MWKGDLSHTLRAMGLSESSKDKDQYCSSMDCDISSRRFPCTTGNLSTILVILSCEISSVCSAAPSTSDHEAHSPSRPWWLHNLITFQFSLLGEFHVTTDLANVEAMIPTSAPLSLCLPGKLLSCHCKLLVSLRGLGLLPITEPMLTLPA